MTFSNRLFYDKAGTQAAQARFLPAALNSQSHVNTLAFRALAGKSTTPLLTSERAVIGYVYFRRAERHGLHSGELSASECC